MSTEVPGKNGIRRSCLACKRKGIEEPCKCRWKDDLSDVLDKIYAADELIIGSPIYFSEPTAQVRGLLERVVFPALSYDQYGSTFKGKINVSVFLTMNMDEAFYQNNYKALADQYFSHFRLLNGEVKIYPFYDTLQVKDYSKYDMGGFDGDHKQERNKTQFPEDLKEAYRIGNAMSCL